MFLDNLTDKATLKNIQSMLPNPLLKGLKPMRFPHYKQENMHSMTIRKLSQYLYIPHSPPPPHHVGHKELEKDLVEKKDPNLNIQVVIPQHKVDRTARSIPMLPTITNWYLTPPAMQ